MFLRLFSCPIWPHFLTRAQAVRRTRRARHTGCFATLGPYVDTSANLTKTQNNRRKNCVTQLFRKIGVLRGVGHNDFLNKSHEPPHCYTPWAAPVCMKLVCASHRHLILYHGVTDGVTTMLVCFGYQPLERRHQHLSTADSANVLMLMFVNIHAAHGASMSASLPSDTQVHHGATQVLSVGTTAVNNVSRKECGPDIHTVRDMTTSLVCPGHRLSARAHHWWCAVKTLGPPP